MPESATLLPGTLDALILKAVSLAPHHGYGILQRIEQMTGGRLTIEQGALYPALHRLEHQGLLAGSWGVSDNNRRARFYRLTRAGSRRLGEAVADWKRLAAAMDLAFEARPEKA